ncbi:MAG: ATPase [Clostridia bacterium]|nr:ATPase [Clostridia bacterium]
MKEEISVKDLNSLDNYIIVDIRDEIAFKYGSIKGAVSIPQNEINDRLAELQKDKLIVVMCKSGIISYNVSEELRSRGYNAVNLKEGYYGYMLKTLSENRDKAKDMEHSIIKKFHRSIWSKFTLALNEYELLKENDRVAVCISGGKDSMLMAKLFQELKRHNKYPFEVVYLVMDPGYSAENRKIIEENARLLDIPITVFETNIFESVLHIEKSPCYICARMRRGYLYSKAKELGCNKIALGHHFDDVIETTLMGMLFGGQMQAMMPKLHSTNFEGMELIRPLYLIHEKDIKHWRDYNGLHFLQCACKFTDTCTSCNPDNKSKRQVTKQLIAELEKDNPQIKNNIYKSIQNVNLDTLIGYKQNGIKHSFLEKFDETGNNNERRKIR